jgi:hypothetical protein
MRLRSCRLTQTEMVVWSTPDLVVYFALSPPPFFFLVMKQFLGVVTNCYFSRHLASWIGLHSPTCRIL